MGKLSRTKLVQKLAEKSFKECDVDGSGSIDVKELHVGILLVYDKLNKSLPVYLKPPNHEAVRKLMEKYDKDGSGQLHFEEFHDCVKAMVGTNDEAKFRDSLPFIIVASMALKMAVFPLAAVLIKKLLVETGGEKMEKVPNSLLAYGVEGIAKLGYTALQR